MARAPVKRFFGTILFLIGLILFFGWLFVLFAGSENIDSVPFVDETDTTARVVGVGLGLIAIVLAILVLVRAGRRGDEDDDMFFIPEKDRVQLAYGYREPEPDEAGPADIDFEVYTLSSVKRQEHAWDKPEQKGRVFPYHFPRSVERGLYANDYIAIDDHGTRVKLRTLIAGPKGAQRADTPRVNKRHVQKLKEQEDEKRLVQQAAELRGDVRPGDGEAFMEELQERSGRPAAPAGPGADEVYYGYGGDNPALASVPGLRPDVVAALAEAGITTSSRLLYEDPARIARATGYTPSDASAWQSIVELQKVPGLSATDAQALADAGVRGIPDLKRRDATDLSAAARIGVAKVQTWQAAADTLRRTKQRVPAS